MTDFSHLSKLEVTKEKTAEYDLVELEGSPTLILCSANENNPGYMNGLLRLSGHGGKRRTKVKIDAKTMETMRDHDKELFPSHVIVGWKGIQDSKGKDVPFSEKTIQEFIAALPNWIFDGIRTFANDPENFVLSIDSEAKAGN